MDSGTIFAIDPGNTESGFVIVSFDGGQITKVLKKGKILNEELLKLCRAAPESCLVAIEMVASYGMAVGKTVFDTCVWIGRFWQTLSDAGCDVQLVYRKEEKMCLCHSLRANDSNITQALCDRFVPGQKNYGKGTKKNPGFFYGFGTDMWAAMAVAVAYFDREIRHIDF